MMTYFYVALGSTLGGILRHWLSGFAANAIGDTFPWGTLIINIVGSFVIGFFATLTRPDSGIIVPSDMRIFVMVGICGGFTTFSSFSLQTLNLARDGDFLRAGTYILLSIALCLLFVWLGYITAAAFNQLKGI